MKFHWCPHIGYTHICFSISVRSDAFPPFNFIPVELRYDRKRNKQLYINSYSNHPPNTKRGPAYGLGLRIDRICEKESDNLQHRQELKLQLRRRGYNTKLIEAQLRKVGKLDRD